MTPTSVTALLDEIAAIGRDGTTGGYRRFAFDRTDADLAAWFAGHARRLGLDVTTDRAGNQWAWWGDPDAAVAAGRPGVVTGSHTDSVPDGGPFDGPLGVATALVAVESLRDRGFTPARPIGVVRFVDEEGARFGLACGGSRLLTGTSAAADVLALRDRDGTTYAEALRAAGVVPEHAGRDDVTLRRVGAFVEVHVEQGRALATPDVDAPLGVATTVRAHGRWRVALRGRTDHAGTTLLADRDDAMLACARFVLAARAAAERHGALATVGRVEVRPGAVNAVPGAVDAWLDVRALDDLDGAAVDAVLADLAEFGPVRESWTPTASFHPGLSDVVSAAVARTLAGRTPPRISTGAGHDAGILAGAGVPSSMVFVRNPTGVSHAPHEHADEADCETGAAALTQILRALTDVVA